MVTSKSYFGLEEPDEIVLGPALEFSEVDRKIHGPDGTAPVP